MFSGITQGLFPVTKIKRANGLLSYVVTLDQSLLKNLKIGASVAIDGVCQTVVAIENNDVTFDAMQATLDVTTLNDLKINQLVSLERSLKLGDEIGGHEVSGHVTGTAIISKIISEENNFTLKISCNTKWLKYINTKGFIALDGSSLTIGDVDETGFFVHIIPETLRVTNFKTKKINDKINVELDNKTVTLVNAVEKFLNK